VGAAAVVAAAAAPRARPRRPTFVALAPPRPTARLPPRPPRPARGPGGAPPTPSPLPVRGDDLDTAGGAPPPPPGVGLDDGNGDAGLAAVVGELLAPAGLVIAPTRGCSPASSGGGGVPPAAAAVKAASAAAAAAQLQALAVAAISPIINVCMLSQVLGHQNPRLLPPKSQVEVPELAHRPRFGVPEIPGFRGFWRVPWSPYPRKPGIPAT